MEQIEILESRHEALFNYYPKGPKGRVIITSADAKTRQRLVYTIRQFKARLQCLEARHEALLREMLKFKVESRPRFDATNDGLIQRPGRRPNERET